MALYSVAIRSTNTAINLAPAEFRAVRACAIIEIGLFQTVGTASSYGFGRPANVPAGGTIQLGQAEDPNAAATTSGLVISGQTTAPTVPGVFMRRIHLPAAIGAGVIWTWPERAGLACTAGTSLVFWNITASVACDIYVKFSD